MEIIKTDFTKTGWVNIKGSVKTIVAHYKDGNKKTMSLFEFLSISTSKKQCKDIVQIDCYDDNEKVEGGEK